MTDDPLEVSEREITLHHGNEIFLCRISFRRHPLVETTVIFPDHFI